MKVEKIITGPLEENCYIISKNNKCLLLDPGSNGDKIIKQIGNQEVLAILVTHSHFDHIGALEELEKYYKCPIYDYNNCLEKEYIIGPFKFEVIYTLGHTLDSISFYFKKENLMFVGDFLFEGTIGRCDLNGNYKLMEESLEKIKTYDKNIIIYSGHGNQTTLNNEKKNNPYF